VKRIAVGTIGGGEARWSVAVAGDQAEHRPLKLEIDKFTYEKGKEIARLTFHPLVYSSMSSTTAPQSMWFSTEEIIELHRALSAFLDV
jgi:hypothetical protein